MKKINMLDMKIHQTGKIETHYIMKVSNGWIYTDRRGETPSSVFVPIGERASRFYLEIELVDE